MKLNTYKKFVQTGWSFALVLAMLFSLTSHGAIENAVIEGIVVSYDKKTVTLLQSQGQRVKVPRKSIPKNIKLKTGIKVEAVLDSEKLMKQIREIKAEEQKTKKTKNTLSQEEPARRGKK